MSLRIFTLLALLSIGFSSVFAQNDPPPANQPVTPQIEIIGPTEIIVDRSTGKGSTPLLLRSATATTLSLTGVVNTDNSVKPAITFKTPNSEKEETKYSAEIKANEDASVIVVATNATQVGEFEVELRNGGKAFGNLKLIHLPFAVTLDGPDPNKADLTLVDGHPTTITIKNDDPVSYPLAWQMTVDGQQICSGNLTLAAKGLGLVECKPDVSFGLSRIQDLFKVESTEGHALRLYPQKATGIDTSSPWKIIPVKASLSQFSPSTQQFWGYVAIVAVLIAGGLCSLLLSQALPNRLKRLNIKDRLMSTARATSNLRSRIGSRLQVLLRLERSRLYDLLESRNTFSPDFVGIATRCSEGTDKLEARVALVQQMDSVLELLDQKLTLGPPPSQIAEVEAFIDDAKVLLAKTQATDKDLEAAQLAIAEAAKKVDALNQPDPAFGESLAKRALEVSQDLKLNVAKSPTFIGVTEVLPGPYAALQRVPEGTTTIHPANYASLDMAVEKMLLLKDYVLLKDGTMDPEALPRLKAREPKLLGFLQLQSWPAMRHARLLLREMKDDVYPERLEEKLLAKAATIVVEPAVAYDKAPLDFCVCFHSDVFDDCAAKEEWTCEWSFGDNMTETGWTASHYFLLRRPSRFGSAVAQEFLVKATFRNANGDLLVDPTTKEPITLEKKVKVQPTRQEGWFGDRSRTELLKLMAALLIAVFALVSGAREQLLKLDILPGLIAVFLVGFGADTIKNLLTKSESE